MSYEDFFLLKDLSWLSETSGTEWFLNIAELGYNIFYLISIMYFGYKIFQSAYNYMMKSEGAVGFAKLQILREILEPIKGLAYLVIGMTCIKIVASFFLVN